MDVVIAIVVVTAIFFVIIVAFAAVQGVEKRKAAEDALTKVRQRYGLDEVYVSPFSMGCIGINWNERRICSGKAPDAIVAYSFEQLRSSEVEVDGVTITQSQSTTKARRGAQIGGAAVGGLVFGPAGLLVGGLTGGNKSTSAMQDAQHVCSIGLVLRFNDRANPIQKVMFWDMSPPGIERHNSLLKPITENANRFHALLVQIIEEHADSGVTREEADPSERLERLWALRQAGALTQSEFEKQKRALLRD